MPSTGADREKRADALVGVPREVEVREGREAPGSAKNVQTAAPWFKALWFGPDALGEGGAGIPTGVAVLALGRIRLTLLTVYALWRLDTAGMPCRAAAEPADAMVPGDAPRWWSERHGRVTFERPGLTRSIPWCPSRLQPLLHSFDANCAFALMAWPCGGGAWVCSGGCCDG